MLSFIRQCFAYLFTEPLPAARPDGPEQGADGPAESAGAEAPTPPSDAWWIPRPERVSAEEASFPGQPIDRTLRDQLTRALDEKNLELPRMPHVAQRVLMALRDDGVNYQKLAELIGQDPVLTAEILRVANSPFFRAAREIKQLEQAFLRLGRRHLRSVVLGASFKSITIRVGGPHRTIGEELWRCSMVAGVVLRQFARRFDLPEEEAFLVGLLHDIGMLVVLKIVHEYQQYHGRVVPRVLFDQLADEWHQHVGMRLAEAWNLPDPLPELIGNHHRDVAEDDPLKTYRRLIQVADAACSMLGYRPYQAHDFFNLPFVRKLGLQNDAETQRLLGEIPSLLPELVSRPKS